MNYIVYRFRCHPVQPLAEILISELAEISFESFTETSEGIEAFIPEQSDDEQAVKQIVSAIENAEISYQRDVIPYQNWNAVWEADYQPVEIDGKIRIRASFHHPDPNFELELVINPRMSFGTGHHSTTALMLSRMCEMEFKGASVLDMGCGTGVLAIAAVKLSAASATAIDVEPIACQNTRENAEANDVSLNVRRGNSEDIGTDKFELILANINKNVLLADIPRYAKALNSKGDLLLSGFFKSDVEEIVSVASKYNFNLLVEKYDNNWAVLHLKKLK